MSGPFVDLPLTTGDYYTQTRQRQMNVNSKVPWERSAQTPIPYEDFEDTQSSGSNTTIGDEHLYVDIDGTQVGSVTVSGTNATAKIADLNIASITTGLHTLRLRANGTGISIVGKTIRFIKHDYMNRLTIWAVIVQEILYDDPANPQRRLAATNTSIINHESVENW